MQFVIYSDHKPVMYLFSVSYPTMVSVRIQRWVLTLDNYDYEILYKQGSQHVNANGCSRFLPLPVSFKVIPISGETILVMEHLDTMPACVSITNKTLDTT